MAHFRGFDTDQADLVLLVGSIQHGESGKQYIFHSAIVSEASTFPKSPSARTCFFKGMPPSRVEAYS